MSAHINLVVELRGTLGSVHYRVWSVASYVDAHRPCRRQNTAIFTEIHAGPAADLRLERLEL